MSPPKSKISPLAVPVSSLWSVGAERAAQLTRLDIRTVEDLLLHRPRRYEDRRRFLDIKQLQLGVAATTRGKIVALGLKRYRGGQKSVFEIIVDDGTARLHCRWWNLPFMEKYFAVGDDVFVFGKPILLKPRTIDHPETEVVEGDEESLIHLNRIVPIYPLTEGVPQRWLRSLIRRTLAKHEENIVEPWPELRLVERQSFGVPPSGGWASDELQQSKSLRSKPPKGGTPNLSFPTRAYAIHLLHSPEEMSEAEMARQRLALDEFIELQLAIQTRRKKLQANARGLPCGGDNRLIKPFLAQLGFQLTAAQTKVLRELRKDMASGAQPMRRLLQGDVGSGKTVVAACCALMALESGFNVALMAPTEILAGQHFQNFRLWFEPLGVKVEMQTGNTKTSTIEPDDTHHATRITEQVALIIGTHALIESGFTIDHLGLVIIDEQHKFGVTQREQLVRKGRYPHLLVMTATPIPRTLGLTLYGDLDVSVIDELPAGRGRIKTFVRAADKLPKVWAFIRERLAEGRQAYVVYPRVEDSGALGVKAVTQEWGKLQHELSPYTVGLMHGRLKTDEKERVMAGFRADKIKVLLATSVIEVGVDVPNATVMLVESAEQFGLAQLHQLRGRIGRGAHDSFCILVAAAKTDDAKQRLRVLAETTDGFRIAEADLQLRGPGELLGQQQSGLPRFRFGDLAKDRELIERARGLATESLNQPKELA